MPVSPDADLIDYEDYLVDCAATDPLIPTASLLEDWGLGWIAGEEVLFNDMLPSYPGTADVDSITIALGTTTSWYVSYDENPAYYDDPGEASGFFGAIFRSESGPASSGLVALYTCVQEFNGNWYVSLGSQEPDNFKVVEEGSNSLGETVYRLEAYFEDIDMRFTVFYID